MNRPEQHKDADSLDNAIAAEKQLGVSSAAESAFRKERKRLLDFIRQRVRTEEDAEDILSDVFYQLISTSSVAEPIEKMTSWLFTVARNRIIDWYRKKRPDRLRPQFDDESLPLNLEDILFDPTQDPDRVYERSLLWTELAEALDDLPKEQREVFVMHELEGKSFKEIAEITGERQNTLLSRKRYAVLYLRERLKELYREFDGAA
ncbi:MAG: RNA polymerase sigma factor [Bacteroidota bacterium]